MDIDGVVKLLAALTALMAAMSPIIIALINRRERRRETEGHSQSSEVSGYTISNRGLFIRIFACLVISFFSVIAYGEVPLGHWSEAPYVGFALITLLFALYCFLRLLGRLLRFIA
ncbi:hypothetical protein [Shimia sp.]|uniref:hypothetical protein n=1 Tax=Shimia sp. TaxID=1954381 RepID=UPI003BAA87A0